MREGDTEWSGDGIDPKILQTVLQLDIAPGRFWILGKHAGGMTYNEEAEPIARDIVEAYNRRVARPALAAAPEAGLPDALLREVVRNGVPPDALMTPKDGPAHENLYRWWHEQWAPTLQKVRAALAAAPEAGLPDGLDDVLLLSMAIDNHNLFMGGLEDHGDGVGCAPDCAGDILARYRRLRATEASDPQRLDR